METVKKLIALMTALPLAAFAQGGAAPAGPGPGAGMRRWQQERPTPEQLAQMQKRARLALTLGLAVALDLDDAQALKLGQTVSKFADRRRAIHEQVRDARETLRRAAHGEKVAGADVDQAIAKALDGRAQLVALDRELVGAVTKDLSPEKKARAVMFLANFQRRFGRGGMGHGHGPGMMQGPGMMRGPGGPGGPGPGMHGATGMLEPGAGAMAGGFDPDDDWAAEE